jgi:hypothetical protein
MRFESIDASCLVLNGELPKFPVKTLPKPLSDGFNGGLTGRTLPQGPNLNWQRHSQGKMKI